MSKKYDWFAASLFQPDLSLDDFFDIGVTPDNSEMKSKDAYKSLPDVVNKFTNTNTGEFDEKAFNSFYDTALNRYNKYSKNEFDKKIVENYKYDPFDWMAPVGAETRDVSAKFSVNQKNPTHIEHGIEGLGLTSETPFSNREIAQANEVRDENGNKLGYTPNEKGGLFKSLSRPTLVLAQYDENVTEVVDGKEVTHIKGELKLDEYGLPYYEELGDREVYGKDVLHYTDTFTTDGSKWNKYDFFDSDGLNKSIGGTIAKTIFEIAPYFIPYVQYGWAAMNAGLEIAQLLPTLSKAVNGVISGNNEDKLGVGLSKWESYLERFESSTSDYSRDKMITTENFGNLIADISGQLWQQRAISYIPRILEKTKLLEQGSKNLELGKNMALAYMAGTSAKESYGAFKEAGASDRVAGIAMVANILALNKLMQNDYFKNTLFKNSWLDEDNVRKPAWGVAKEVMNDLSAANNTVGEEANKKLLSRLTGLFTKQLIPGLSKSEFIRASVAEGVEETMEEAVLDLSKAFTEGLNAVGVKVTEDENLNFGWSVKDMLSRYAMSFGGGMIGGALFQANNKWETRNIPKAIKEMNESDRAKMTYLLAQGRGAEIKAYYKKLHDKGLLGDPNLSASKLKTTVNLEGVEEVIAESAEKGQSQNDFVYNALLRHVDYLEELLADEKMKVPAEVSLKMALGNITPEKGDEKMLRAQVLNLAMENSGFLNEFNRLASEIVKTRAALEEIYSKNPHGDSEAEKKDHAEKLKANETVKQLTEKLKQLRKRRDDILAGKYNWYYVGQGLFALDEDTNKYFFNLTKDKFSQVMYGRMYNDLTPNQKEHFERDWQDYQNTEGKKNTYRAYEIYIKLWELAANDLIEASKSYEGMKVDTLHSGKTNLDLLIEKNNQIVEINKKIKELQSKEVLSPEEEETLQHLEEQENNLKEEYNYLGVNTETLLRGTVEGEPNNFGEMSSDLAQLQMAFSYIKSLYSDFISNRMIMRSEDELDSFYRLIKKNPWNAKTTKARWDAFMNMWIDNEVLNPTGDPEEVNKDLDNKLMTEGLDVKNPLQDRIVRILSELEEAIGSDYSIVQNKYAEAVKFVMEHTNYNEQQAKDVINAVLPRVGSMDILNALSEIETLRKNVTFSPIYDVLRRFKTTFSDGTLDVVSMIQEQVNKLAEASKYEDFTIGSKQMIAELKETMRFLDAIKSLVNGSYSGINSTINRLKKGSESEAKLPELTEEITKLLFNDIEYIQQRIGGLLTIALKNDHKKLKIHKETEIKMKPLMIRFYMEDHFKDEFKTKLNVDINDIWKRVNKYNLDLKYVDELDWQNFEETRLDFESELRTEILKNNTGDFSQKLVSCFGEDLYKQISTKIDPDTTAMSAYDMLLYTVDIIGMDSKIFSSRYKEVLSNRKDLAPIFGQELAIRKAITATLDPTLYNTVLKYISELNPSSYKKPPLSNMINIFGGAGTGKTVAISSIAAEILAFDENIEFVYLAPSDTQVKNLNRNVGKEGTTYTIESFENEFFKFSPTFGLTKIKSENKGVINWSYSLENKKLWKSDKKRKVLIVDESSLFNAGHLSALSTIATNESGIVWTLGDNKQNAAIVDVKDGGKMHSGLEDFTIAKSPELTTALRPDFLGKFENSSIFDKVLTGINREAVANGYNTLSDYDKLTNTHLASVETIIKYYETEDGSLYGEKFISEDELAFYINRLKGLVSDISKIAIISDTDVTVNGIKSIRPEKAQGGEWEYVIVNKKWSSSRYDKLRDLYTLTQRSTKGSVIVDNGIVSDLNIKKKETPTAAEPMVLSSNDRQEFIDWKINSITVPVISSDFVKMFDREPIVLENTNQTSQNNPTPEVKPEVNSEVKSEEEVAPEANLKPDSVVQPTIPPVTPVNTPSKPKVEENRKDELNIPKQVGTTNEEAFFDILYNGNVWKKRKNERTGLFSLSNTLTTDAAIQIAEIVSSSIKENDKDSIIYLLKILRSNNIIDTNTHDVLDNFFKNAIMELHVVPNNDRSLMVARFIDFTSPERSIIELPITVLSPGLSGKYNGEFTRMSRPQYQKGEWKSIEEIKQRYPWLKVFNTWQVISVDSDLVENDNAFSDKTKDYLLGPKTEDGNRKKESNNNGNVFTLVTDSFYLMQRWDNDSVYALDNDPEYPGYKYTHMRPDRLTNIGLNKLIKPSNVVRYSLLLYYKDAVNKHRNIPTPILDIDGDFDAWMKDLLGTNSLPTKDFYKREHQIISAKQCSRLLTELFNLSNTNRDLARLIGSSLKISLGQEERPKNGRLYKSGLLLENEKESFYIEFNNTNLTFDVFSYNASGIDQLIKSISPKGGLLPIEELKSITGDVTNISSINRVLQDGVQIEWHNKFVYNQIMDIIGNIENNRMYGLLDEITQQSDKLKYGLFSNVRGAYEINPFHKNGVSRKFVGKTTGYSTNASIWTPSVFSIDISKINRSGDEKIENERVTFETQLDEIKTLVSPIISVDTIWKTIDTKRTQNYEETLQNVISYVNDLLLKSSKDWNYRELIIQENGDFALENRSNFNQWLSNKFGINGEINFDCDYLNTFKIGIFSVSLSEGYAVYNDSKQWNVIEIKSYNTLKSLIDEYVANPVIQQQLPNFMEYIKMTIDDSVNTDIQSILDAFNNSELEDFNELLVDYLADRIQKEEC